MSIIPILVGPISWEGEDDFKWLAERQIIPGKPTPLVDYAGDIKKWEYVKIEILEACKRRITEIQKGSETIPDQAGIIKSNRSDKINDQDKPALNLHRYYKVAIAIIAIVLTVLGLRKFLFVSSVTIADKDGITSAALSIVEPKSGASLPSVITVRGTASRHDRVWLIVHPTATSDYWVQAGVERGSRGEWLGEIHLGSPGSADRGKGFEVLAVAEPEKYLEEGMVLNGWPVSRWRSNIILVSRE